MKHFYSALAAGLVMAAGAMNAEARYWTYDWENPVAPDAIEAGQWYALQGGQSLLAGSYAFLAGDKHSDSQDLTTANLYQFVATGEKTADGAPVYTLKDYEGNYLYAPGQANFYGPAAERAWKVVVREANAEFDKDYSYVQAGEDGADDTEYTGMNAYIQEAVDNGEPLDLSAATFCNADDAVVIGSVNPDDDTAQSTYTYLLGLGEGATTGNVGRGTNYDTNTWVIWAAQEQDALASLEAIVSEMTDGEMDFDLSGYQLGEGAGEYSQELYDAFMALWAKAEAAINDEITLTDAELDEIGEKLPGALEAFKKSGKGLTEGYYILRSMRASKDPGFVWGSGYPWGTTGSNYDDGAIYDGSVIDPNDGNLRWSCKADDEVEFYLDGLDKTAYETAKFVWHATKSGNKDNEGNDLYYFQNIETGKYIGKDPKMYSPVVMHDTPQVDFTIAASPNFPGWFSFYSPELTLATQPEAPTPADYSGLHTERGNTNVVAWDWRVGGSCWKVETLTEEEVQTLKANLEAPQRLNALKKLVTNAQEKIANGYVYDGYNADGTKDEAANSGSLAPGGLVTSADQLDCPMIESTEGNDLNFFLDGDKTTFVHSTWSAAYEGDHYLQITIANPESDLIFKWAKRVHGNANSGAPLNVIIWGTDNEADLDNTGTEEDLNSWQQTWKQLGTGTFNYKYAEEESNTANFVGLSHITLSQPSKYLRMTISKHVSGDAAYFYGSEFRLYKAVLNLEESPISAVPENVLKELQDALAIANEEIADGAATAETIEKLQAAYDKFLEHYPTPERLTDAIAAAKELVENAEEGEDLGYYQSGSIAKYQAAIEAAEAAVKPVMSNEEIDNAKAALDAATEAFNAALRVPANGLYVIRSKSSNTTVEGQRITATYASAADPVKLLGGNDEANADLRAGSYWQTEKAEGGYTFKNLLTGLYLAPRLYTDPKAKTNVDAMVQSTDPYVFAIRFAREPGCFNFVIAEEDAYNGDYLYVNAQPGYKNLVTWHTASGRDNSAFTFEAQSLSEVEENLNTSGLLYNVAYADAPQAYTFPVDIDAYVEGGAFYSVIGQNAENNIELAKEESTLKAGNAYIYIPEAGSEATTALFFLPEGTKLSEAAKTNVPAEHNGLMGVFESVTLESAGFGIFSADHKSVLVSEKGDAVGAGTGYFCQMPETTEKGDVTLTCNGKIDGQTGINNIIDNTKKYNAIYSISGVRVNSLKNLPAGLYIINGKKYIVK